MSAVIAAALAVLGTLLGSITTGVMHRRAARDNAAATERAAVRRDQVDAVSALAASAADHRRTSYRRRQLARDGATQAGLDAAKEASDCTRSAMAEPLARVRLLIEDRAVRAAVDELVHTTFGLRDTPDIEAGRRASIDAHDRLLDAARAALHPPECR